MATKTVLNASHKSSSSYTIPPDKLAELEVENYRYSVSQARVEELADEIASVGRQHTPALIKLKADRTPLLYAGDTRRKALMLINKDPAKYNFKKPLGLLCTLQEIPDGDSLLMMAWQSNGANPPGLMDQAMAVQKATAYDWSVKEIANRLRSPVVKLSIPKVINLLAIINRLPVDVHDMIATGDINYSAACQLLRYAKAAGAGKKQITLLASAIIGKLTFKEFFASMTENGLESEVNAVASLVITTNDYDEIVSPTTIKSVVNGKKRIAGTEIKRTVKDLESLLKSVDTAAARMFLGWLEGDENDEDIVTAFLLKPPM